MIHHTFTHSVCIHGTTGKRGLESHFLHLFFIENHLIIFNSYNIVMTGYMHTMLALCVLHDYIFYYKVIFIIYLPLKVPVSQGFQTRDHSGSSACRGLTDCTTTELSKTRYWLSIYEHIHSSEIEFKLKYFSLVPVIIWTS